VRSCVQDAAEVAADLPAPDLVPKSKPKPKVEFYELKERGLLGCGSFGRVTLVEHVPVRVCRGRGRHVFVGSIVIRCPSLSTLHRLGHRTR